VFGRAEEKRRKAKRKEEERVRRKEDNLLSLTVSICSNQYIKFFI